MLLWVASPAGTEGAAESQITSRKLLLQRNLIKSASSVREVRQVGNWSCCEWNRVGFPLFVVGHSLEFIPLQFAVRLQFRVGIAQVFEMFARPDWLCSPQAPGCLRRAPGAAEGAGDAEAAGGERVRTGQGWERDLGQLWGSAGSSLAPGGFFSL